MTAQQRVEAFRGTAPRFLLQDRDAVHGPIYDRRMTGIERAQALTALRSSWQISKAERLIGRGRRVCLAPVDSFGEASCRRVLARYVDYSDRGRTHVSLALKAPDRGPVQPQDPGAVVAIRRCVDRIAITNDELREGGQVDSGIRKPSRQGSGIVVDR